MTGIGGLVAAARALYNVSKNPNDPDGNRLFLVAKNNIGIDTGGCEYSIEGQAIDCGIETSKIHWDKEASADAYDVMSPSTGIPRRIEEARELILSVIAAKDCLPAARMYELAGNKEIAISTLNRARRDLGIVSRKEGDLWFWYRTEKMANRKDKSSPPTKIY